MRLREAHRGNRCFSRVRLLGFYNPRVFRHCCHSPDCGADCRAAQPGSCPLPPGWRGALLSGSFARFGLVLVRRRFFLRCPGPHCLSADRRSPVEAMRSVVDVLCCRVVKERGSVAWPAVCAGVIQKYKTYLWQSIRFVFYFSSGMKKPARGGLFQGGAITSRWQGGARLARWIHPGDA